MDEPERQHLLRVKAAIADSPKDLAKLSPRERDLLRLRVGLEDGQLRETSEIADLYGVPIARIRILEDKALRKLGVLNNPKP